MAEYNYCTITHEGNVLRIEVGESDQNGAIVSEVVEQLQEMIKTGKLSGGSLIMTKIIGPASLPVAAAIGHELGHFYETVAVFDPKLAQYVVVVTHGTRYKPGNLIG